MYKAPMPTAVSPNSRTSKMKRSHACPGPQLCPVQVSAVVSMNKLVANTKGPRVKAAQ